MPALSVWYVLVAKFSKQRMTCHDTFDTFSWRLGKSSSKLAMKHCRSLFSLHLSSYSYKMNNYEHQVYTKISTWQINSAFYLISKNVSTQDFSCVQIILTSLNPIFLLFNFFSVYWTSELGFWFKTFSYLIEAFIAIIFSLSSDFATPCKFWYIVFLFVCFYSS